MDFKTSLKRACTFLPIDLPFPLDYVVPLYHSVSNEVLPHIKNVIRYKNVKTFEKDLDFISQKFEFTDWVGFKLKHKKKQRKPFALLTFDDGLVEFKDIVLPILKRKGIYAMNFINPGFLNNGEMLYRMKTSLLIEKLQSKEFKLTNEISEILELQNNDKGKFENKLRQLSYENTCLFDKLGHLMDVNFQEYKQNHKIYMNEFDLEFVHKEGFGIAAHSWDHPLYSNINLKRQLENTQKSIDFIRNSGFLDQTFSFPFTDSKVKNIFFEKLFSTNSQLLYTFGTAGVKLDSYPKNIQRVPMEKGLSAKAELRFQSQYFYLKKMINKEAIIRK